MRIRRFFRSEEGSALIEFAMLSPVFFMLVMGLVEFVLYQYKCYALNHVVYEASRRLLTGEVQNTTPPPGQTTRDVFRAQVCTEAGALIDCNQIDFDVRNFNTIGAIEFTTPTFNAAGRATNFQYSPGVQNQFTVVQATYPHTFVTPFMGELFGEGNRNKPAIVSSFSITRGEPW